MPQKRKQKRKRRLVRGKGPLQGIQPAWQEGVRGESTWCIVSPAQDSLKTGGQLGKEEPATPAQPLPGAATSYGAHRAHTLSTHTVNALSLAFTSLNIGTTLTPALNSDSTLISLFGTSFHAP